MGLPWRTIAPLQYGRLSLSGAVSILILLELLIAVQSLSCSAKRGAKPDNGATARLHLLSLQYTPPDNPNTFSETVASVWRWKDTVLGNGQDYFVPKPKTLQALQSCFTGFDEVVIISNCARLELLIVCDEDPKEMISRELLHQVQYHQEHPHRIPLSLGWDMPSCIDAPCNGSEYRNTVSANQVQELMRHWTHFQDSHIIARHLCMIAASMAVRPRRPGRPVPFQPFSSRDAHVLLQLKRTLDICKGKQTRIMLKGALEAGKAVRNEKIVPELTLLRQYGTGDSKYSVQPPTHVVDSVTQAAIDKGLEPALHATMTRLALSLDEQLSQRIASLRQQADALGTDATERGWIRKRLHEPTMLLRRGESIHVESFLNGLSKDLERIRMDQTREAINE